MTRSPKKPSCSFDNTSLKRWLLKIGPPRRIILLKKFKQRLVDLGLPQLAVRTGLLQLASHPFVRLNRLATTQKKRKSRMRGPKSRRYPRPRSCSEEKDLPLDHNNNNSSNDCSISQGYSPRTSEYRSSKHSQDMKHDRSDKHDHSIASPEHSSSGGVAGVQKKHREKRSKSRERRSTSRSRSKSKTERSTHERHSTSTIDITDVRKPSNYGSEIRKQQREKEAKKNRLKAKFREIFGDDEELELPTSKANNSETSEDAKTPAELELISRKSPVFCNVSKKRKRRHDCDRIEKSKTHSNTEDCNANVTVLDIISSDSHSDTATTIFEEDIATRLPDPISASIAAPQSTDASDTSEVQSNTTDTAPQSADETSSDSKLDLDREKPSKGSTPEGLAKNEAILSIESLDKMRSDPPSTGQAESEVIPGLGIEVNHEAESPQEPETTDLNLLVDTLPQVPAPSHTPVCMKHETVDPPFDKYEEAPWVNKQEDRFDDPSSTTDTLPPSGASCINDRLPGALDNICLALHCRRRVDERQKTASKLAIKQNRHQELVEAHRELKLKMIVFRKELVYLFSKLQTWHAVLRFICEGLDHRTSPGTRSFEQSEVEAAMKEANVKITFNKGKQEESPEAVHMPDMGRKIIFEIDLTDDNECDSSTDPPKSTFNFKSDSDVDSEDTLVLDDRSTPSIAEVRSISPQQFETIGETPVQTIEENPVPPKSEDICPCFVCSSPSSVACGRCGKATYCSKRCQEFDWVKSHHITCVPSEAVIRCTK